MVYRLGHQFDRLTMYLVKQLGHSTRIVEVCLKKRHRLYLMTVTIQAQM